MNLFFRNTLGSYKRVIPSVNYNSLLTFSSITNVQHYTSLCYSKFQVFVNKSQTKRLECCSLCNKKIGIRHESLSAVKINVVKRSLNNFLNKIFFINSIKQKQQGLNWYRSLDELNYNEFFSLLKMPDTFFSWFKVTELHVWMILLHLMEISNESHYVRIALIEVMWIDVEKRAKLVQNLNLNYKKNMSSLYTRFKMSLFVYDEGFLNNDMALANAVWVQFFEKNVDNPRLLEVLVSYIRHEVNGLKLIDEVNEKDNQIVTKVWSSLLPHYKSIMTEAATQ